ncbi:MAG: hypothetical protein EOO67_20915, partial [Microbacterium sp.]
MTTQSRWDYDWIPIYFVSLLLVAFLLVVGSVDQNGSAAAPAVPRSTGNPTAPAPTLAPEPGSLGPVSGNVLPGGRSRIFADDRVLVSYYGTAGTGSLGVLGEGSPDEIMPRLTKAARAFAATGRPVQPVFELIVTVAHAGPTQSGQYSSDIDRVSVQGYIDAAHEYGALVVLDLQPGRANFLEVAKRWEWALKDPLVGLALDPEWRMSQGGVPGQRIGSVSADEINEVSRWLEELTVANGLPEKVFVLHQFRTDMIRKIAEVAPRAHLAM